MFEISVATPEDQDSIQRLQSLCPYPLTPVHGELIHFVARSGQGIIGAAGMELLADQYGLVRTLSVIPGYRKHHIAQRLLLRLIAAGSERRLSDLFAPGLYAEEYFRRFGFVPCPAAELPTVLQAHPFPSIEKLTGKLMRRSLQSSAEDGKDDDVVATAHRHFEAGLLCAESVLAAVAEHLDIHSPLIPGIATGFSNGVAGTWSTCGCISGGVLAINVVLGRQEGNTSIAGNYQAVRQLIQEFQDRHGSTQCSELLACDPETQAGRSIYRNNRLNEQCRKYIGSAAAISLRLIREHAPANPDPGKPAGKNSGAMASANPN